MDIDFSSITEKDRGKINRYIHSLVDGNEETYTKDMPVAFIDKIDNYAFMLETEPYVNPQKGRVTLFPSSFLRNEMWRKIKRHNGNEETFPIPCYHMIDFKYFSDIVNLDFDDIYDSYTSLADDNVLKWDYIPALVIIPTCNLNPTMLQ